MSAPGFSNHVCRPWHTGEILRDHCCKPMHGTRRVHLTTFLYWPVTAHRGNTAMYDSPATPQNTHDQRRWAPPTTHGRQTIG